MDQPPLTISRPELLDGDSDARFRQLLHRLLAFAGRLEAVRAGLGQLIGLSGVQYTILICIAHLQGERGVGVKAIADHLGHSGAFVTIEAGKLAEAGLVDKRPNPADRRRVLLTVTAAGRARLDALAPSQRPVNDALFASLDRSDFERLSAIAGDLVTDADHALALLEGFAQPRRRARGG
ncbi:MarR family winged helix-turn-helix transcriptional regulator [Marinibaculum pumilum]|uniref:MarR family winged helix-turn-helix transcriptional regulator n=1 Tax=Marinibaculum pumilum TaxID=1766165 RepID=A0ABV7L831_9PROT